MESRRLIFRPVNQSDTEFIFQLRSNAAVNQYTPRELAKSLDEANDFIQFITNGYRSEGWHYWIIVKKDTQMSMGTIGLWNFDEDQTTAELGYELLPAFQRQGFMFEALEIIINWAFANYPLQEIVANTHFNNEPSRQLLLKSGFAHDPQRFDETDKNLMVFVLKRTK
ncbi:GNAT family N-acetyltransferase [bacterium]|nr:GNAT family N-acetyltransferase [bacterium]